MMISDIVDPSRDEATIREFVAQHGAPGSRVAAENIDAGRPGFWKLAPFLISSSAGDERVLSALSRNVMSGGWQGSPAPMISNRLEQASALKTHPDPLVAEWAQTVVNALQRWLERAEHDDAEDWIWDRQIRRAEFEAMIKKPNSPERLWAIARLLESAPRERVLELLSPEEIRDALSQINLDQRKRRIWESYIRHSGVDFG